jgi:hypothetical protein
VCHRRSEARAQGGCRASQEKKKEKKKQKVLKYKYFVALEN